jgi:hypothetical protein
MWQRIEQLQLLKFSFIRASLLAVSVQSDRERNLLDPKIVQIRQFKRFWLWVLATGDHVILSIDRCFINGCPAWKAAGCKQKPLPPGESCIPVIGSVWSISTRSVETCVWGRIPKGVTPNHSPWVFFLFEPSCLSGWIFFSKEQKCKSKKGTNSRAVHGNFRLFEAMVC